MSRILLALSFLSLTAAAQEASIREASTLFDLPGGPQVVHGTDPGDFYCEHAFFASTSEALRPGSSILRNEEGEPLVGFLHVPHDRFKYRAGLAPDQAERHADRRRIVGAAIRGLVRSAAPKAGEPFRILLTGYGQWGPVLDNPSGDFVVHAENVEAAMEHAFGGALAGHRITSRAAECARFDCSGRPHT